MTPASSALRLPSELTHRQATACLAQLLQSLRAVSGGGAAVVDASALQVFDTSALAVLLEFRREALAAGVSFGVQGLPAALQGMAGLYGVDALLQVAQASQASPH